MAEEPLPPPEVIEDDDDGGGPVKPFLEHLEDLRWTIIKVLCAVIIAMLVCLVAGKNLVHLLIWPLQKAQVLATTTNHTAVIRLGESVVGRLPLGGLDSNLFAGRPPGAFRLTAVPSGTNLILALAAETNAVDTAEPGIVMLKNYGPISAVMVALKLALVGGISLSAPFIMLFIGQFIVPALKVKERRFVYRALGVGIGLFILGVVFCYFVIMQITLLATVQFSQWLGFQADEWRAEDYIDFVLKMMLAVGLSFQLPVVILALVRLGLLSYRKLIDWRSYFIVLNLVLCAVLTPSGDPFTMLLLAVPVQILYEVSVFIAWTWYRRDQREEAAAEAARNAT